MDIDTNFLPMAREAVYRHASRAHHVPRYWTKHRWEKHFGRWHTLLLRLNDLRIDFWHSLFKSQNSTHLINDSQVASRLPYFEYLWRHLESDEEKDRLLQIFTLRMISLGHSQVPVDALDWTQIRPKWPNVMYSPCPSLKTIKGLQDPMVEPVDVARFFPSAPGIVVHSTRECLIDLFLFGQYQHPAVHPEDGDICIDCGAFMGETSIWMAAVVGERGRCYAIEMMPENVERIRQNLRLNAQVAQRVEIVQSPLGSQDGVKVGIEGSGATSRLIRGDAADSANWCFKSITLDSVVRQHQIQKLNFIKMDVEGAELDILKGGIETFRRFLPKLAISLYHDDRDFERIPKFIDSLGLGYRFYIGHHHFDYNETILYAKA